jgi:hypothetical protein
LEVIAARVFNHLYIYIDIIWLVLLLVILIAAKRYTAIIVGLIGGLIYFIVDYGIFYHALGTRFIEGANPLFLLLWLSISYGFTNFVWIWLWLDRDGYALEWSILMISGWFTTALLSQNFGNDFGTISIHRGTASYHGIMALILFIGYLILILMNLKTKDKKKRFNILWILSIGILVQFSWEAVLLITGIRAIGWTPLIINSLLETNLGLPFIFLIHRKISSKYREDLKKI